MLTWEPVKTNIIPYVATPGVMRAKVPGGWLIAFVGCAEGGTFMPDPEHKWDGSSPR